MALIAESQISVFDLTQIERGYLLWGKHATWDDGKAGFVTAATEEELVVQYFPGIGNVTNHFHIPVGEVLDGQWQIRWSRDMSEVSTYGIEEETEESGDEA